MSKKIKWTRYGIEWEAIDGDYRLRIMPTMHLFIWEVWHVVEVRRCGSETTLEAAKAAAEKALAGLKEKK